MSDSALSEFEQFLKPLWMRAQGGDEIAYELALKRIAGRLRGYLNQRLSGSPGDVEDLVQEILLAVHLQRGTYDPAFPVSAWVFAIARHKLIDFWRRRGRRESLHDEFDEVQHALNTRVQTEVQESMAGRDLDRLLEQLPAVQRTAISLTKIEGLSVREAAQQTGSTEAAIKVQVHRGLKRLMALVKQ